MIPADVALSFERLRNINPSILSELTAEQEIDLDYVDSVVESLIFKNFEGKMFETVVPAKFMSVMEHLKQRYANGGWSVGMFPQLDGDNVVGIRLILSPGTAKVKDHRPATAELPPVFSEKAAEVSTKRLLVRMPTRGRPAQALSVLQAYREMAGMPVMIEVVIDEDDEKMQAADVLQRLNALGCVITTGKHKTKIEAVNGGRVNEWDVLILASDDMVPVRQGYAVEVMKAMEENWPYLDGALYFDDSYAHERCCTLPVIGRRFYDQFKVVYEPEYKSLCCDVEQTELWQALGRLVYVPKKLIEHRHPAAGKAISDALYDRNETMHGADLEVYKRRKAIVQPHSQFLFDSPPLWLSICVATVPARRVQLDRLLDHLWNQIIRDTPREVEIVVDDGPEDIGVKRQNLISEAKGHFVVHIDDDDWVSDNYVDRIVRAVRINPDTDCVSLSGIMTTFGSRAQKFEHSIKNPEWSEVNGMHLRCPNHLNAVKRELALQAGFVSATRGEDYDFSKRLYPLLKKEVNVGDDPLYFYWYNPIKR